jgi:hypothetical protein
MGSASRTDHAGHDSVAVDLAGSVGGQGLGSAAGAGLVGPNGRRRSGVRRAEGFLGNRGELVDVRDDARELLRPAGQLRLGHANARELGDLADHLRRDNGANG